jgi:hypothetical protein
LKGACTDALQKTAKDTVPSLSSGAGVDVIAIECVDCATAEKAETASRQSAKTFMSREL